MLFGNDDKLQLSIQRYCSLDKFPISSGISVKGFPLVLNPISNSSRFFKHPISFGISEILFP